MAQHDFGTAVCINQSDFHFPFHMGFNFWMTIIHLPFGGFLPTYLEKLPQTLQRESVNFFRDTYLVFLRDRRQVNHYSLSSFCGFTNAWDISLSKLPSPPLQNSMEQRDRDHIFESSQYHKEKTAFLREFSTRYGYDGKIMHDLLSAQVVTRRCFESCRTALVILGRRNDITLKHSSG